MRTRVKVHLSKRIVVRSEDVSLRQALKGLGWCESTALGAKMVWDVWLNDAEAAQHAELLPGQLISRFPAMADCCRKAMFATLLDRMHRLLPADAFDGRFFPRQWALPLQLATLATHVEGRAATARRRGEPKPVYIVKPSSGSSGDGIVLSADPTRVTWNSESERVVQVC